MIQKTAMSKLYSYLHFAFDIGAKQVDTYHLLRFIEQLKELEKQQIIDAHNHGEYNSQFIDVLDDINGIEYYNKTYNK